MRELPCTNLFCNCLQCPKHSWVEVRNQELIQFIHVVIETLLLLSHEFYVRKQSEAGAGY